MIKKKIFIFAGPSGSGKSTIQKELMKSKELNLDFAISATTRPIRKDEVDGISYYFHTKEEFDKKIKNNSFIEWSEHFGFKYGTLKSEINRIIKEGRTPFLEIETNGVKQIIDKFDKKDLVTIFLRTSNFSELKKRIKSRKTETKDQIVFRLAKAKEELKEEPIFDYVVINDGTPENAIKEIREIIIKNINEMNN